MIYVLIYIDRDPGYKWTHSPQFKLPMTKANGEDIFVGDVVNVESNVGVHDFVRVDEFYRRDGAVVFLGRICYSTDQIAIDTISQIQVELPITVIRGPVLDIGQDLKFELRTGERSLIPLDLEQKSAIK